MKESSKVGKEELEKSTKVGNEQCGHGQFGVGKQEKKLKTIPKVSPTTLIRYSEVRRMTKCKMLVEKKPKGTSSS